MIVLIFMKWSIDWDYRMFTASCFDGLTPQDETCDDSTTTADMCPLDYGGTGDGCQPPNLITTLINIALAPGSVDEPMYAGQGGVQVRTEKTKATLFSVCLFVCARIFLLLVVYLACFWSPLAPVPSPAPPPPFRYHEC